MDIYLVYLSMEGCVWVSCNYNICNNLFLDLWSDKHNLSPEEKVALIASTKSPISFLSKLGQSIAISRKRNPKVIPRFPLKHPSQHISFLVVGVRLTHDISSAGQKREGRGRFGEETENQPV